ncbi:MAG: hypothetical protein Q4C04_04450 [Clostridia bacterium]|nr:hypothetical protein [Clostridia bacterium]
MAYSIGAVVSVSGDQAYNEALKKIRTEMSQVKLQGDLLTSTFGKNEKSVASLTSQNNQLRKAQDLQEKTIKETEAAMQRLREENLENSEQYKKLENNLTKTQTALNKTTREIKENEAALEQLKREEMHAAFDKAQTSASSLGSTLKTTAAALAAVLAAAVGASAALVKFAADQSDAADELLTRAQTTGTSVETLQEWAYAARFIDTEVEHMEKGLARTVKAMSEATIAGQDYIEIYDGLVLSMRDGNGQLYDSEEMFYRVIDAIGTLESETEREIAAQEIFSRSYQDMLPLINAGSQALREYADEAHAVGAVVSTESVQALGQFNDALQVVRAQWEATKTQLAASFANPMTKFAENIQKTMASLQAKLNTPKMQAALEKLAAAAASFLEKLIDLAVSVLPAVASAIDWLAENGRTLIKVLAAVVAGVIAFKTALTVVKLVSALSLALQVYKGATIASTAAQYGLNAAMAANPIGLLIVGITTLVAAMAGYSLAASAMSDDTDSVRDSIDAVTEAISEQAKAASERKQEMQAEESTLRSMAAEVSRLSEKENISAGEKLRLKTYIEELNGALADANLAYDENTGAITGNIAAVDELIAAKMREAEVDLLVEKWQEAEQIRLDAIEARDAARAKRNNAEWEYTMAQQARNNASWFGKLIGDEAIALNSAAAAYEEATGELRDANAVVAEAEENASAAKAAIDEFTGAISEEEAAVAAANVALLTQEEALEKLNEAYTKAAERVEYYADYTQNAFSRMGSSAKISVEEMIANLQANQAQVAAWTDNMAILAESGLDSGFLQALRDMGPEAAATVQGMVDYIRSGGSFDELNRLYADGAAQASAAVESELETVPGEFLDLGENIGSSLAQGITNKIDSIYAASYAAGQAAIDGAADATDTHSPSRKGEYLGKMFGVGYGGGLSESFGAVLATMRGQMRELIDIAGMTGGIPGISATMPQLSMTSGGSTVVNLTVTNPSEAWLEYVFDKFNVRFAGVA